MKIYNGDNYVKNITTYILIFHENLKKEIKQGSLLKMPKSFFVHKYKF